MVANRYGDADVYDYGGTLLLSGPIDKHEKDLHGHSITFSLTYAVMGAPMDPMLRLRFNTSTTKDRYEPAV